MSTKGRLAVVTGASSGIGRASALALARGGWRVVLVARRLERLEEVQAQITRSGGVAVVYALSAADGEAVVEMARSVVAEHGAPEVIINSAGAGQWKFIEDTPPKEAQQMMDAPYVAAYNTTHAFMRSMLDRGKGVIIHVGSPASIQPWPGATAYIASRWALRGLHEALCMDLAGTGLHSCHVVFGKVTSAYFDVNPHSEEYIPRVANIIPISTPEQCAEVILGVIKRPRAEVLYPRMLHLFNFFKLWMPETTRRLVNMTGRRR